MTALRIKLINIRYVVSSSCDTYSCCWTVGHRAIYIHSSLTDEYEPFFPSFMDCLCTKPVHAIQHLHTKHDAHPYIHVMPNQPWLVIQTRHTATQEEIDKAYADGFQLWQVLRDHPRRECVLFTIMYILGDLCR